MVLIVLDEGGLSITHLLEIGILEELVIGVDGVLIMVHRLSTDICSDKTTNHP